MAIKKRWVEGIESEGKRRTMALEGGGFIHSDGSEFLTKTNNGLWRLRTQ